LRTEVNAVSIQSWKFGPTIENGKKIYVSNFLCFDEFGETRSSLDFPVARARAAEFASLGRDG
jgi:hypothetical protein